MAKYFISFFTLLITLFGYSQKEYKKIYYPNGNLKEEGWIMNSQKIDYWYFYNSNGNLTSEGHYKENKKTKWWIFYDSNKNVDKKCEFKNNVPDGLCLIYDNGKIKKAEKFDKGKKVKIWTELSEFKKDNNI